MNNIKHTKFCIFLPGIILYNFQLPILDLVEEIRNPTPTPNCTEIHNLTQSRNCCPWERSITAFIKLLLSGRQFLSPFDKEEFALLDRACRRRYPPRQFCCFVKADTTGCTRGPSRNPSFLSQWLLFSPSFARFPVFPLSFLSPCLGISLAEP